MSSIIKPIHAAKVLICCTTKGTYVQNYKWQEVEKGKLKLKTTQQKTFKLGISKIICSTS